MYDTVREFADTYNLDKGIITIPQNAMTPIHTQDMVLAYLILT